MRTLSSLRFVVLAVATLLCSTSAQADEAVYELRVYTCEPGKLDALHTRFREHTMKIFAKHGIENVAYWTPTDEPLKDNTLIYLLKHKSREEAKASWDAFRNDLEWKAVAKASREAHGKILSKSPESTYLVSTDYSSNVKAPNSESLFELRTYTAAEGKLDALNSRFRDHTDQIFKKHGMTSYGYWTPQDEPKSGNTLVYVLEHPNAEAAKSSWKDFASDPDWHAARDASEANGKLLVKKGVTKVYMKLTDYSPTQN